MARTRPEPERLENPEPVLLSRILLSAVAAFLGFAVTELIAPEGPWSLLASLVFGIGAFLLQVLTGFGRRGFTWLEGLGEDRHRPAEAETSGAGLPEETIAQLVGGLRRIEAARLPEPAFQLAKSELARMATFFEALGDSTEATYEGEDRDWLLALTRWSHTSIEAVSLYSVDVGRHHFLAGDLGRRYLAEQARVCDRGVRIRRIHVLDAADSHGEELREICRQQRELGIDVRILNPNDQATLAEPMRDVVVFDGAVSYETTPAAESGGDGPIIVATRLVLKPEWVRRRSAWFGELWEAATEPFDA
ncbi:DUF6879 family protein [Phytomonospora sp. NPDC050363]|uniref:DUF6879 family protein n=1 Tax=Phytomonospora sp. NPDC050363 TaxID=3155642 RepID=UPI00340F44C1